MRRRRGLCFGVCGRGAGEGGRWDLREAVLLQGGGGVIISVDVDPTAACAPTASTRALTYPCDRAP